MMKSKKKVLVHNEKQSLTAGYLSIILGEIIKLNIKELISCPFKYEINEAEIQSGVLRVNIGVLEYTTASFVHFNKKRKMHFSSKVVLPKDILRLTCNIDILFK